jgi:hypothetical protein
MSKSRRFLPYPSTSTAIDKKINTVDRYRCVAMEMEKEGCVRDKSVEVRILTAI